MRSPTIKDVAKRAGVGVGTVSRVINGSAQVREETRQKVLAAIKELGFSPNNAARRLSGGKTSTIGVITPFFTFPSFVDRLSGIQEVLDRTEYDLVLYSIRSSQQLHQQLRIVVGQNRVDGLIVLSMPFHEDDVRLRNPTLPIVVVDNAAINHYPHLMIDNVFGGRLATDYLIQHGHQAIGFICDEKSSALGLSTTITRYEGYKEALQAAGLELNERWVRFVKHNQTAARQAAYDILCQSERPTALFVTVDTLAFGALAAARDLNLRVPQDIAVIGFDDIQAASYMGLTTVRQSLVESGRWGATQLLTWLRNGSIDRDQFEVELPLRVIERTTV